MAYPIRFKLINKETGEVVKGNYNSWNDNGIKSAILLPDGTPAIWSQNFYHFINKVSCADYDLFVATKKVNGKWDYKQVGF